MNWRLYLMLTGAMGIAFFAVSYFAMLNDRHWTTRDWIPLVIGGFIVGGLIFSSSAFANLRSKERKLNYLLIPASQTEKFLSEWIIRFIGYILVFLIIIKVFGGMAFMLAHVSHLATGHGIYADSTTLKLKELYMTLNVTDRAAIFPILAAIYFGFSLAFAGAVVFMKQPLVKTVLFVGSVVLIYGLYFYIIIEEIHISEPFFIPYLVKLEYQQAYRMMGSFMVFCTIWVLAFSFIKLREKEV